MMFLREARTTLFISMIIYGILKLLFIFGAVSPYVEQITLYAFIVVLASLGLNVIYGYTGQFSLGHAAFYGIGAYVSAYLGKVFGGENLFLFLINVFIGGTAAALVAYLIGMPILRLKDDFLGIATLGFAMLIRVVLDNSDKITDALGGSRGFIGIAKLTNLEITLCITVFLVILTRNLIHSRYGLFWRSVKDDEVASISIGIDTARMKIMAFTYGCFLAGVAGALYGHLYAFLHPSNFDILRSIDFLIIVILGGTGNILGTICAGLLWVFVIEGLRVVLHDGALELRWVIIPLLLIILMIWRPHGLIGGRKH